MNTLPLHWRASGTDRRKEKRAREKGEIMKMHEEARRAGTEKNAPAGEGEISAPLFDPESLAVSLKRGVRLHETDGRAVLVDADGVALALPLSPETRRIF